MLPCLAHRLPDPISSGLFGDRKRWGPIPDTSDPDWLRWEAAMAEFYKTSQHEGIGVMVNVAGYRMLRRVPLDGRRVLEIGPGGLYHAAFWQGRPAHYVLVDRRDAMLDAAAARLSEHQVPFERVLVDGRDSDLPFGDDSFDTIVSYYALEHLHPLEDYVAEYVRVLRPGGLFVGGIPAEGGLAWGLGRALTTARLARNKYGIDLSKIICWEHPNFADHVIATLDKRFKPRRMRFWPLMVPAPDANLIISFVYEKA